jgi:type III restriction enzyme
VDELHDAHRAAGGFKVLEEELGEVASADKDYDARLRSIVQAARIEPQSKERWQASSTKKEEVLRELVDTVGKPGQIGQDLQNVVSVAMLSRAGTPRP